MSFDTKSYKKVSFTDASPRSDKKQEYKPEMGGKMKHTLLLTHFHFSEFYFQSKFQVYSMYFALHAIAGSPVNFALALYFNKMLPSEFLRLKTSKQGKIKAEKLFERSEFFSAVDECYYVFSKNSVSNELFLLVSFLFCGKKEKYRKEDEFLRINYLISL